MRWLVVHVYVKDALAVLGHVVEEKRGAGKAMLFSLLYSLHQEPEDFPFGVCQPGMRLQGGFLRLD